MTPLNHLGRQILAGALLLGIAVGSFAEERPTETTTVIYATGFEADQGFDPEFTIVGQDDWRSFDDGGNGLVENFFEGEGQQAFIGLHPPIIDEANLTPEELETAGRFFSLLRFVNVTTFSKEAPLIKFQVTMEIVDSTNGERDNFRWSVYNLKGNRLFSVDFDNETKSIAYALDDDQELIPTEFTFDHLGSYDLEITMNFLENHWSAALNGVVIVENQPITTRGAELTLSDIDAVWAIFKPESPGDNYMLFDNYSISRARLSSTPSRVQPQGMLPGGKFVLRVFGEPATDYRVEATSDFIQWTPIQSGTTSSDTGTFDMVDEDAGNFVARFYRAITVR